ncbi:hypothetical protein ACN47E_009074 [Coniothyrium glycines]
MSGPFRFAGEEAKSPLDRSASPFSAGQPVSFKTNVNRMKTKKWVQAKKNAYDGDDWGDYDEYDEYGVNQEPAPSEPQRYYAQSSRSFTDPSQQAPLAKARRNSFEHGEEQRAFSSSIPPPQQGHEQTYRTAQGQHSGSGYAGGSDASQGRDFSASAMPHPLQTRMSQVPADIVASPTKQFPPRKSSIGQAQSPTTTSPRPRTGSSDKPLPFIRPADIYKRVEEERVRERSSLDSGRPSLDSLSSPLKDNPHSPQPEANRFLAPLETVAERKSEYLPEFDALSLQASQQPAQAPDSAVSQTYDQGFRSVVDRAFVRNDDTRSVPPTPISKEPSSEMSRTNTGSTSGISPIMSRVPSSATPALRSHDQTVGEGDTPVIAEEPSELSSPIPQPTSSSAAGSAHPLSQQTFVNHSRNISASSLPRSGLATPTRGDSPARSPVVAPQRNLPEPESAQFGSEALQKVMTMEGGLSGPSSGYTLREADIANTIQHSPIGSVPALSAAAKDSQDAFLESHTTESSRQDALPRDRSESPSKGRVQALAGKFGEVSHSRRGSTQSNMSRNSVQSWERSQDNSRAASPTKGSPSKPGSPVKEFRPHLPGQWESYATTAPTPLDANETEKELGHAQIQGMNPSGQTDLTPVTAKRSVIDPDASKSFPPAVTEDPIAALRDAGAAMVNSIRQTIGLEDSSETSPNPKERANHGDIYLPRPLQLDRTASSISSMPPTPPAKDTPASEFPPPAPLKDHASESVSHQQRPDLDPQLSTDTYGEDQESDRLRKEIVASLSPMAALPNQDGDNKRVSFVPGDSNINRASSILPSEYDTYWADEDHRESVHHADDKPPLDPIVPLDTAASSVPVSSGVQPEPVLLNRFSWEANTAQSPRSDTSALVDAPPEPVTVSNTKEEPAPAIERSNEEHSQQRSESVPEAYFGPGHTFTVTKPDPVREDDLLARPAPTSSADSRGLTSPTLETPRPSSPGLHVVNTRENPEAVDLPPRFSAEHQQAPQKIQQDTHLPHSNSEAGAPLSTQVSPIEVPLAAASQEQTVKPAPSDKPLGTREIATITSTAERIATYNQTRDHWATTDHGLGDWLSSTLKMNPDLATQAFPVQRMPTASTRHRHTGSIALLGKLGGSNHHDLSAEQSTNSGAQAAVGPNSPTSSKPSGPSAFGGRVASQQLKTQGKDLLHTANVLSGKGMTSAKGLFAKGKSRFGREKVEK